MAHPKQEEWMEYLYGEVDPQRQELLSVHVHSCPDCRQQVSEWRSAMKGLDSWVWTNGGTQRRRLFLGPVRWAAAVLIILSAGIVFGRFTANQPNVEQLQEQLQMSLTSYLEPILKEDITNNLNRNWFELLAASRAQFREDIQQQIDAKMNLIAAETLDASTIKTNELLFELIQQLDGTLLQMEQQRLVEMASLQGSLNTFAVQASDEILRNRGMVQQLDDKIKLPQKEIDKTINN